MAAKKQNEACSSGQGSWYGAYSRKHWWWVEKLPESSCLIEFRCSAHSYSSRTTSEGKEVRASSTARLNTTEWTLEEIRSKNVSKRQTVLQSSLTCKPCLSCNNPGHSENYLCVRTAPQPANCGKSGKNCTSLIWFIILYQLKPTCSFRSYLSNPDAICSIRFRLDINSCE